MILFSVAEISDALPGDNQTWPSMYAFAAPPYPVTPCGNLQAAVSIPGECCISAIEGSGALYSSGTSHIVDPALNLTANDLVAFAPSDANGHSYCHLAATVADSLLGYSSVWILAQDAVCVEGFLSCSSSGVLQVWDKNATDCSGNARERYPLSDKGSVITSGVLGGISAGVVVMQQGTESPSWTEYAPGYLLIPNFKSPIDYIATILYSLALLGALIVVLYAANRVYQRRTHQMIILCVSQLFWLAYVCFRIVYIYSLFPSDSVLSLYSFALGCTQNLAMLLTALYTANFLFAVVPKVSRRTMVLTILFILVLHFGLAGSNYLTLLATDPSQPLYNFINRWDAYRSYFTCFLFFWNIVPVCVVVFALTKEPGLDWKQHMKKVYSLDAVFYLIIVLQLLTIAIYFTIQYLQTQSSVLGDDRTLLSMSSFICLLITTHFFLNCVLIERIKLVLFRLQTSMGYYSSKSQGSKVGSASKKGSTTPRYNS
ncbi:hypothetical protein HDV03_000647 [Kappamyces sp. JEL0829]|nr:hypothetical protein HDV03_000647 [Kappamyces sp. JEL0829]